MKPIDSFNAAIERGQHLLWLYDLLHDSRQRGIRADWSSSFKNLMRWPKDELIERVDGKDQNSILILRQELGVNRKHFTHDYLSELLRASVVAAISALDRYMHDLVLHHSWRLLSKPDEAIPGELKKIAIPIATVKNAIRHQRRDPKARPGHLVKKAIQERLHRDYTFQKPDDILRASKMLGVSDFWQSVADQMPSNCSKNDVISTLRRIATRRNQVVHEADLIPKTKAKEISLRDITRSEAESWTKWMIEFVKAIDSVVSEL